MAAALFATGAPSPHALAAAESPSVKLSADPMGDRKALELAVAAATSTPVPSAAKQIAPVMWYAGEQGHVYADGLRVLDIMGVSFAENAEAHAYDWKPETAANQQWMYDCKTGFIRTKMSTGFVLGVGKPAVTKTVVGIAARVDAKDAKASVGPLNAVVRGAANSAGNGIQYGDRLIVVKDTDPQAVSWAWSSGEPIRPRLAPELCIGLVQPVPRSGAVRLALGTTPTTGAVATRPADAADSELLKKLRTSAEPLWRSVHLGATPPVRVLQPTDFQSLEEKTAMGVAGCVKFGKIDGQLFAIKLWPKSERTIEQVWTEIAFMYAVSRIGEPGIVGLSGLLRFEKADPYRIFASDDFHEVGVIMACVDGVLLDHVLMKAKQKKLTFSLNARFFVAARLAHYTNVLHQYGITHRDLYPRNVIIDRAGFVYVIDWSHAGVKPESARLITGGNPIAPVPFDHPSMAGVTSDAVVEATSPLIETQTGKMNLFEGSGISQDVLTALADPHTQRVAVYFGQNPVVRVFANGTLSVHEYRVDHFNKVLERQAAAVPRTLALIQEGFVDTWYSLPTNGAIIEMNWNCALQGYNFRPDPFTEGKFVPDATQSVLAADLQSVLGAAGTISESLQRGALLFAEAFERAAVTGATAHAQLAIPDGPPSSPNTEVSVVLKTAAARKTDVDVNVGKGHFALRVVGFDAP